MPELAEVEFYKRRWEPALGQTVRAVRLHRENRVFRDCNIENLINYLPRKRFTSARAHGKQMLFRFGAEGWLGVHLGMAGKLFLHEPAGFERHKHDHLVLQLSDHVLVFRDTRYFGKILWHRGRDEPDWWSARGPDLLSDAYTQGDLDSCLLRRPRTPVKSLLLDQQFFPGIGNWMADEILWRAAVHPCQLPKDLSRARAERLFAALKDVCRDAIRVIAPDWSPPPPSWLFPHRWKDGGTCPRTGKPLQRIKVGGRTTCYSPARQGESP